MERMGLHTWSCPACGRNVPLRVAACHCGMTRALAEERAALAEAEAARPAETVAAILPPGVRPALAPRAPRVPRLRWKALPGDVRALLAGFVLVVLAGLGWLVFGPRPAPITPVLGYVDAGPPPTHRPRPSPTPPFKLPWWK
jgi:hypothetical protein